MIIGVIVDLIKTGMEFFVKRKIVQEEVKTTINFDGQIEVNKEEIQKVTIHWRNCLGFVLCSVVLWNWLIVPVLATFGITAMVVPIPELVQILMIMLGH